MPERSPLSTSIRSKAIGTLSRPPDAEDTQMEFVLSTQLNRVVGDVRGWSVSCLRPYAREADRLHSVPAAVWKAFEDAPFGGDPVAGRLELDPSRGVPEGKYTAGTALAEAAAYGDMVWIMMTHGIG